MSESIDHGGFEANLSSDDLVELMGELSARTVEEFDEEKLVNDETDTDGDRAKWSSGTLNYKKNNVIANGHRRPYKLVVHNASKDKVSLLIRINNKDQKKLLKRGKVRTISVPIKSSKVLAVSAIHHSGKPTKKDAKVRYRLEF